MRISLNCYPPDTPTGLGTLARSILAVLPFDGTTVYKHPKYSSKYVQSDLDFREQLLDSEVIVAIERPLPGKLFEIAKSYGKRTVLVVMHEWINKDVEWLQYTDLFVAPNTYCFDKLLRLGIDPKKIVYLDIPLNLNEYPFEQRRDMYGMVFSNGNGGVHDRKGFPEFSKAMTLLGPLDQDMIHVISQKPVAIPGVYIRRPLEEMTDEPSPQMRYGRYTVALAPSRCEGFGLGIIEPMLLGLPVITTDACPMGKYVSDAYGDLAKECLINPSVRRNVEIWNHPVKQYVCDPQDIACAIRKVLKWEPEKVAELSLRGRKWAAKKFGGAAARNFWKVVAGVDL